MKILLIGPQGSGKSTQAQLLAQFLNIPKISTGDIFRKLTENDNEEGRKIKQILDQGKLVDDQTTSKIVEKKLKENDYKDGFVMDGYPRNLKQVDYFDPNFDIVFYLKVPNEEIIKRLMERGRADDTLESIKTRLDLYLAQTQPLLKFYKDKGILKEIDGTKTIDQVQNEIKKFL